MTAVIKPFHVSSSFLYAKRAPSFSAVWQKHRTLVFVIVQFHGEFPRQFKSGDKAIDGGILRNTVFASMIRSTSRRSGFPNASLRCSVALLNFLLLRREFRVGV